MDNFDETMKDIKDNLIARIQRQEKEIEDLKEQVEYQDLWREEYLSRINKAIEYMQIFVDFDECLINGKSFRKAIDILRGSDKE